MAVADAHPEKLLGVRDGVSRFFGERLGRPISVAVVAQETAEDPSGLPLQDDVVIARVRERARALEERLRDAYHLYAASEGGLHGVLCGGDALYFVRNWTVVCSPFGEGVGGSGSVQLPDRLVEGLSNEQIPFAVPGTRRRGGMISSLTGGLENRRRAIAAATVHALSTLFYGILDGHRIPPGA